MTPSDSSFADVHMKASVIGTIKKIATGYIGGARYVCTSFISIDK